MTESVKEKTEGKIWGWMFFVIMAIFFLILKQWTVSTECFVGALGLWGMEAMYRIVSKEIVSQKARSCLYGLFALGISFMVLTVVNIIPPIFALFK